MKALALVHDEATADDVVEDAVVAALVRPPPRPGEPAAWLRAVVKNLASLALRRELSAAGGSLKKVPEIFRGRGVRTPIRKALLAGSATKETYGRAFGFERMMDTVGSPL